MQAKNQPKHGFKLEQAFTNGLKSGFFYMKNQKNAFVVT